MQYDYDGKSKQGFVYLPRMKEAWGDLNGGSIYHGNGIEGHWFHATDEWRRFVEPILDNATIGCVGALGGWSNGGVFAWLWERRLKPLFIDL